MQEKQVSLHFKSDAGLQAMSIIGSVGVVGINS